MLRIRLYCIRVAIRWYIKKIDVPANGSHVYVANIPREGCARGSDAHPVIICPWDGRVVSGRIIETPQLKLGELLIVATMTLSRVAFYAFLVGEEIL